MTSAHPHARPSAIPVVIALLAGAAGSGALAVAWNMLGWAPAASPGYEWSRYFAPVTRGFVLDFVVVAFILGWATRQPKAVAFGTLLPLLIAVGVEIVRDPTSHNMIPFEAALLWLPGFGVAWGAAYAGRETRGSGGAQPAAV
jgi:hypothetical protein